MGLVGLPIATAAAAPGDPTASTDVAATAAILPLTIEGELAAADRDQLMAQLVEGLQRGAFGVVEPGAVADATPSAASCSSADCYKKVAAAVGATHVVRTVVTVEDRDYKVSVTLHDGKSGRTMATTDDACEICGVVEAGSMLSTAAVTLKNKLDALAQGPSTLGVTSDPAGAEIQIDGELVGTAPFEGPVIPGKHVLRVSKDGFITVEREVTFVEGVAETLAFELEKVPSRLPARPYGWVSLGFGVAGLATATTFAVLDDREIRVGDSCRANGDGETEDEQGNCSLLYDVDYIVLGSAIAGAALTTLGIAILINSSGRRKARGGKSSGSTAKLRRRHRRPRPQWGVGPGSVTVRGRF